MFSINPFKSVRPTQKEAIEISKDLEDVHRETNARLSRMAEMNWGPGKKSNNPLTQADPHPKIRNNPNWSHKDDPKKKISKSGKVSFEPRKEGAGYQWPTPRPGLKSVLRKTHHLDDHDNTDTDFIKLAKKSF